MTSSKSNSALVVLGHGSTKNAQSGVSTRCHAAELERRGIFAEVRAAFWKEEPPLTGILDLIESEEVYLAPHFISEGYFTQQVIPRALGLSGPTSQVAGKTIHYCRPVGTHPKMKQLLWERITQTVPPKNLARAELLIAGHGTGRDARSSAAVEEQVAILREKLPETHVMGIFLDQEPRIRDWRSLTQAETVVVAPFFATEGLHTLEDIPEALGITGPEVFGGPFRVDGRRIFYCESAGTSPLVPDLILELVAAFDRENLRRKG